MDLKQNRFWQALRGQMEYAKLTQLLMLLLVTAMFPVMENVLTSKWLGTPPSPTAGWCLLVIGAAHGVLTLFFLAAQSRATPAILADAFEADQELRETRAELKRRTEAYRLVRSAFDQLNARQCNIDWGLDDDAECSTSYWSGVDPIVQTLVRNIGLLLKVKTNQFSVLLAFRDGFLSMYREGNSQSKLEMAYEHGHKCQLPSEMLLTEMHLLPVYCFHAQSAGTQSISSAPQLVCKGSDGSSDPDYKQFAWAPVLRPCTDQKVGVLIVTAAQDEPLATDAVDTLQFIASILGSYTSAFIECVEDRVAAHAPDEIHLAVDGEGTTYSGVWTLKRSSKMAHAWECAKYLLSYSAGSWAIFDATNGRHLFSKRGLSPEGTYHSASAKTKSATAVVCKAASDEKETVGN